MGTPEDGFEREFDEEFGAAGEEFEEGVGAGGEEGVEGEVGAEEEGGCVVESWSDEFVEDGGDEEF